MKRIFVTSLLFISFLTIMAQEKEQKVEISTDYGKIVIKLYNNTPQHRDNFIKLVKEGYYDGLIFHRVIKSFMIQGGDPNSKNASADQNLGNGGPGYTIPAEIHPENYHKKGAVAGARLPDNMNPKKESSGSQFYIVQGRTFTDAELNMMETRSGKKFTDEQRKTYKTVGGTPHLDGEYTVFGEVVSGLEVLDKIAAAQTGRNDRPQQDIKMTVKLINPSN